jgi:hypothetical protein
MRCLNQSLFAAACGLTLLVSAPAADPPAPLLPDADYPKLVEFSSGVIRDALKGQPDKRAAGRARTAAIMIAAYAQQNLAGPDGQQRATLRDAALELAGLIKAKDFDKALKKLDSLPTLKADAKAKKEKLALVDKVIEVDELMHHFRQPARGGLGIETRLDALGTMEGGIAEKELDDLLLRQAYLLAVAAEVTAEYTPPEKDKVKDWQAYCTQMRQGGSALAAATKARDGKAALRAVEQLNQSCTKCHKDFR